MFLALGVVAILLVAVVVNGVVATLEDEAPGGFDNPDGQTPPTPIGRRSAAALRWTGVGLGTLCGLYLVSAPLITDAPSGNVRGQVMVGLVLLALSALLLWRRQRAR